MRTAKPNFSLVVILAKYFGVIKPRRTSRLGLVVCKGQKRNASRNFISKTKSKRPRDKPSHGWDGNILVYLKRNKTETVNGFISLRIETVVELLLSALTDLQIPWNLRRYWNRWGHIYYFGRTLLYGVSYLVVHNFDRNVSETNISWKT